MSTSVFSVKKGFAPILIIVIVAVSTITGGIVYWQFKSKTAAKTQSPAQTTESTSTSTPAQAALSSQSNETANWKTYTADNGVSFKYPGDWTLKNISLSLGNPKEYNINQYALVTSPNGFNLYFVPNLPQRGGGCGQTPNDPREFSVNVYSIKPTDLKNISGKPISLVEWSVSGGNLKTKGTNFVRKEIMLSDSGDYPKLGVNGNQNCLVYEDSIGGELAFSTSIGTGVSFQGKYSDDSKYQSLSTRDYFALPDVQTAEKILNSIKY